MTQVTYQLDRRFPIAVVRLAGALTGRVGGDLRAALLGALLAEPTAVIVDLGELTVADEAPLRVLPTFAAQAAQWPGADLLLCRPRSAVAEVLTRSGVAAEVAVYDTFPAALARAATNPLPLRMYRRLAPTVHAPRAARELVVAACTEWRLLECVVSAEMIASELVTNAVRHASTPIELRLTLRERRLRISVHDRSVQPARLQTPEESDDHGRGLLIVDSVASDWGNEYVAAGKVVWATVPVGPPRSGSPGHPRSPAAQPGLKVPGSG